MEKLYHEDKIKIKKRHMVFLFIIIILIMAIGYHVLTPPWQKSAHYVANLRPYEEGEYDCDDMSILLISELVKQGYDARMEISQDAKENKCNILTPRLEKYYGRKMWCHAWVTLILDNEEIHIEATTGEVINNDYYVSHYLNHGGNKNV